MVIHDPQHDLVGWKINNFWLGKTIEISSLDKKPCPIHAGCGIQVYNLPVTQWWCYT